jgi:hypothetical protein
LARVVEVLARPEDSIVFGRIEDRLSSLNVVADKETEVTAELRLAEISVKGAQSYARTTAIVRLNRQQLKPRQMDFSAAERWL